MYLNTSAATCREASGSNLAPRQSRFSCPIHHAHLIRIRMVCRIPPGRVSIRASSAVAKTLPRILMHKSLASAAPE